MITHIECVSRSTMESMKPAILANPNIAVISIIDPNKERIFECNTQRIQTSMFHDMTPCVNFLRDSIAVRNEKFMDGRQAFAIIDFIENLVHSKSEVKLFINCTAGIARSGAVAVFAKHFSTMKDNEFACVNSQIDPNEWVLWKLIEVWKEHFSSSLRFLEMDKEF